MMQNLKMLLPLIFMAFLEVQAIKCKVGMQLEHGTIAAVSTCPGKDQSCARLEYNFQYDLMGTKSAQKQAVLTCIPKETCNDLNDVCEHLASMENLEVFGMHMDFQYSECQAKCCDTDLCNAHPLRGFPQDEVKPMDSDKDINDFDVNYSNSNVL